MQLLTKESANAKTAKSAKDGRYLSTIMHLAPAHLSGRNVCASASSGCIAVCLNTAGRGRFDKTQQARIARTRLYFEDRANFFARLVREISAHCRRADKLGKIPAVRLNGTSDIVWEHVFPDLFTLFSNVQFYDYTKHVKRCLADWKLPSNYHLTFSRSEVNHADCIRILDDGRVNVAVVFSTPNFPSEYDGFPVYSADDTDLRFIDNGGKGGAWGGLKAKGKAKQDKTGFVIHV